MINNNDRQNIGGRFLEEYLKVGFGIMTKSNLEVLLFHLMQEQKCFNGMTNFAISKELKISEERVAKLAYNAQLMYSKHDDDEDRLKEILRRAQPKNEGKKIQFSIEDAYLRKLLRSKIREKNQFSDGSFQSDIVSVDIDTYIELVEDLFYTDKKHAQIIVSKCKGCIPAHLLSKHQEGDITFHWLLKNTLEGACKEVGKVGVDSIATLIGGVNVCDTVVKSIKEIFNKLSKTNNENN